MVPATGERWHTHPTEQFVKGRQVDAMCYRKACPGPCPYTVGKRSCVAGAQGHAGAHDWPKAR